MRESLVRLIKLQAIDTQLMEIEEQKGDLPVTVEYLKRDLENLEQGIAAKSARLQDIEQESRQLKATLAETRARLKKYQEQLLLVSTNRAYDALTAEIDTTKKTLDEGEFHLLELSEEKQRLTDELKADELKVGEKNSELAAQQESLKATIAATEARDKALKQDRVEILARIEPRFLNAYERIRSARDGIAVVPMTRDSCGVCFNRIPPQQQVEIKARDKIVTCESCGVILYWKED
ncbi:MAG: zinc ribbon domain-containing protein [Candidatus Neomarinimicrobiota bacterium]